MGNQESAFMNDPSLNSKVKFKGGEPSYKERVEAFFEINSFEKLKEVYDAKEEIRDAFDEINLKFPNTAGDVPGFLYDLEEDAAKQLIEILKA